MLKYSSFVKLLENKISTEDSILNESGGYGHLLHPYEDMSLTFADIKQMSSEFISGAFTESNFAAVKCISGDSVLELESNGKKTIKDVVDNKVLDKVLSFNEELNEDEYLQITNWSDNGSSEDWLRIELENGEVIEVTPNHRIFVESIGDLRADQLTTDMKLIVSA